MSKCRNIELNKFKVVASRMDEVGKILTGNYVTGVSVPFELLHYVHVFLWKKWYFS